MNMAAELNETEAATKSAKRLPTGASWGLLFTSMVWIGMWLALAINLYHAEMLQKLHSGRTWVVVGAAVVVLIGAGGAMVALDELCRRKSGVVRLAALWLWMTSASVGAGALWRMRLEFERRWHGWPWLEILIGTVVAGAVAALSRHRSGRHPGERE